MLKDFKRKLSESIVLGTWVVTNSPQHCEIMGRAGLDFLLLDMEHGTLDFSSCENLIRACELTGCLPIVRLPKVDVCLSQRILDCGAQGVIYPQIRSAQDAREAVSTLMFPPKGIRGFNPFTRAGSFGLKPGTEQEQPLRAIIVENQQALAELDEILEIEDLDMIYLGTYDMSVDLGIAGQMQHAQITKFVTETVPRIREAGKTAGVMVRDPSDMKNMRDLGANFMVQMVDTDMVFRAFASAVADLKSLRS